MLNEIFAEATDSFKKAVEAFKRDLSRLRTGRANPSILEGVKVDYFGSPTPVSQVASINISDPRLITVKPWDKTLIGLIEKAILAADIGITPNSDGIVIRLPIPALTVERRKDLARQIGKMAEGAKVSIRNNRRDCKSLIDGEDSIPEDEQHKGLKELQDLTDQYVKQIDVLAGTKETEIMEQ